MVMSFDAATAALNMTMSGEIALATECNPLHGPRVDEIIKALEAGEEVEKETFVDETMFATDDTVATVDVDGESYEVTAVTQEVIDGRAY